MGASMGTSGSNNTMFGAQQKGGSSGQSASYNSLQNVFAPQASSLGQLYDINNGALISALGNNQAIAPGLQGQAIDQSRAATGALQNMLRGGAYAGMDSAGLLQSSLGQTLNSPTNTQQIYASIMGGSGNPYVEAMNNSMTAQARNALDLQRSQNAAQAAGAGMGGSSRQGVADAISARDINNSLLSNMANIGYQSYGQDLQNKLNIAQQADSNTLARQQMLSGIMGNQNMTTAGALGMAPTMQSWNSNPLAIGSSGLGLAQSALSGMGSPIVLNQGGGSMNGASNFFGAGMGRGSGNSKAFSSAAKM